jgi:predicted NBD/HSP70 family sugar kinase
VTTPDPGALERLRVANRGVADVVYVKVASGLGAGIVLGGRLHRGATGGDRAEIVGAVSLAIARVAQA